MRIYPLLTPDTVAIDLDMSAKNDVLKHSVQLFSSQVDKEMLINIEQAVLEREAIMSTGVGKGLAIPHAKVSGLEKTLAALIVLKAPIDYQSIDDKPVQLIFLIVGPESNNSNHIKLLSRISRMMNMDAFRSQLLEANDFNTIYSTFETTENEYFPA